MQHRSVAFAAGRLTRGPLPEVDLTGFLILPGMVDIHAPLRDPLGSGGAAERQIDPHQIREAHLQAARGGVTTQVSVLDWGWRRGLRSADLVAAELRSLAFLRPRLATDSRIHLLAEMSAVRDEVHLLAQAQVGLIHGVIFADTLLHHQDSHQHSAAQREARTLAQRDRRDIPRHLCRLAESFDALSLTYGSHADPDAETRERHSMIGAQLAVFPATRRAAVAAHAMMSPVILTAPALACGERLTAGLIGAGICDALASDGRPGALFPAIRSLARSLGWPRAWALVSSRPAEILRLPDRGRLEPGLRADLVVIQPETGEIQATICAGRLTHLSGEAAGRFRAQAFAAPLLPGCTMSMAAE